MFLKQPISKLEWFLKNHVTLKTVVMSNDAEISTLHHRIQVYLNKLEGREKVILFSNSTQIVKLVY